MKKAILIFISALFICSIVNAQYRINKTKYDFHKYSYHVGDPYNPSVSGLTSFFIPGLGQMLSGEVGRGFGFLSGYLGSISVSFVGLALNWLSYSKGVQLVRNRNEKPKIIR
jgi:hypothetical protein